MHKGDMNIFHRYLLRKYVRTLALSLAWLIAIFGILALMAPGVDSPRSNARPSGGLMAVGVLVAACYVALPLALLVATLITVGDLARYQELTALAAAGWSKFQIMRPIIYVALFATVLSVSIQLFGASARGGKSASLPSGSLAARGQLTLAAQTELHASRAFPLMSLFAVLTAIPLASTRRRSTIYSGFGSAVAVLVVYYMVTETAMGLGRLGGLSPIVAGWIGPVVFALSNFILWRQAEL